MGDMKDKVKGFMKKMNNQFSSSSSGKFKGQGRVLGSSSTPANSNPTPRPIPSLNPNSKPSSTNPKPTSTNPKPSPHNTEPSRSTENPRKDGDGFDLFDSLVTNYNESQNGYSLNVFECPVCKHPFGSGEAVFQLVDVCLTNLVELEPIGDDGNRVSKSEIGSNTDGEVEDCVGTYVSRNPSEASVDIVLKLLRNIGWEPKNVKFRRIRMSNPKIKQVVGDVAGGLSCSVFWGLNSGRRMERRGQ